MQVDSSLGDKIDDVALVVSLVVDLAVAVIVAVLLVR